ncbi:LmbE-like protein [Cristinia sonorae]|uniref:N-acetylglucosaminylphosphatidylinositol deacetylase n=1 Tax=Cristinia sonorae TaxID=1940300 RepID=A0A8K0UQD6_9AGAR|nr:LmbE-like protein [Cristinia sonorae]
MLTFPALIISLILGFLLNPMNSHLDSLATSRILLLTAHPDDECLFFAPTVLSIQRRYPSSQIYSICMSVGNADGLGVVRKKELEASLDVLGIDQDRRWVLDHPELKDNISVYWNPDVIASVVQPYVLEHSITTILTFDGKGISSHPNHISLPNGISHLVATFPSNASSPPPRVFTLITVPLVHKYIGVLSPLLAKLDLSVGDLLARAHIAGIGPPSIPVAISDVAQYRTALRAMQQHSSQLVWFRWLYVSFSRYMWVNEWAELTLATPTSSQRSPTPLAI